ncbi:radical SAM protein [Methylomarinum vadi]|uniref:radical SAM protein n=1 Tax=Methylomarinum vadi TaxID=438855 RepID=UPI0004DFCD2D|nr:radical SAM protein [Methylomarinum vadi]
MTQRLTTTDHRRDAAGLHYIYPVISRRAGGLSIGINFNTNNSCNWRCVYCQVPDLKRGSAPPLDFALLESELKHFLDRVLHGDFFDCFGVPEQQRVIKDIAISGNGEPTSLPEFAEAVRLIGEIGEAKGIFPGSGLVLITNGSLMHQAKVQEGLRELNRFGGEVWFKLDSPTKAGRVAINNSLESDDKVLQHLHICAGLCPTKLQTCVLNYKRYPWSQEEKQAYLELLSRIKNEIKLEKIMLYSIARQSMQPEANELTPVPEEQMREFAKRIEKLGYKVSVSV